MIMFHLIDGQNGLPEVECTPINWGLNTPQNVPIYLGASVCIYFCENCVPSDASVDMPKWLTMGAKGLSKKSCDILA